MLISPCRSTTETLGWWRTLALSVLVGMVVSFKAQNKLDGMVFFIAENMHLVNHVLDQKQTPAARRLEFSQLGLDVRRFILLWRGQLAGAAFVADAHGDGLIRRTNLEGHRQFRVIVVAMLHGVHGRLGHC